MSVLEMQAYALAVAILCGISLGFLFDVFLASKSPAKRRGILRHVGDFLIWLPATIIVLFSLIYGNWGEIRVFSFLGIVMGYWLYKKMGSPVLFPAMQVSYKTMRRVKTKAGRSAKRAGGYIARSAQRAAGVLANRLWVCRKKEALGEDTNANTATVGDDEAKDSTSSPCMGTRHRGV
ncbi:MAG TPA: hypothetical protein GX507_01095 [Clostridia bacterium]|nr:hypothetical protein [Clostridia bacterium]